MPRSILGNYLATTAFLAICICSMKGKECEIDLLVIGSNGIFAVEVKNHKGKISKWMQTIGSKKRQGEKAAYTLRK